MIEKKIIVYSNDEFEAEFDNYKDAIHYCAELTRGTREHYHITKEKARKMLNLQIKEIEFECY